MKQMSKRTKYVLTLNALAIIITWVMYKKSNEFLDKLTNNEEKNNINKHYEKELIKNLTDAINWTKFYNKIFCLFGAVLSTLTLTDLVLGKYSDTINKLNKKINHDLNLSKKINHTDLSKIKRKLFMLDIEVPKFKSKDTLLEQINNLLEIITYEQEKINKKSIWQAFTNIFLATLPFKRQTYIKQLENEIIKETELANLKTWLETQKLSVPIITEQQIQTISELHQSTKSITIKQEKTLSSHFLEVLWPKWFNYNLTDEEKLLLNTAYQNAKEKVEKKFWKFLKEHKEQIKKIGIKSFVETHSQIKKDYSKFITMINEEALLLDNNNKTNKNLNL